MSEKPKKFEWDNTALIPDSMEVTFPAEVTGEEAETVKQWELSRPDLISFVAAAMEKKFVDDKGERLSFETVADSQETLLWEYMAKSSREAKDESWYKSLRLGTGGLIALVEAFLELNHLEEIMASGGNWFMLPTIRQILSEAESESSESPKPTMEPS